MNLNLFAVTSLISCLSSLGLVIYCLFLKNRTKLHWSFLLFNISVSLWSAGCFFASAASLESTALLGWGVAFFAGYFISPFFLHFFSELLQVKPKKMIFFAYGQAFFMSSLHLIIPSRVIAGTRPMFGIHYLTINPFLMFGIAAFYVCTLYALFLIATHMKLLKGNERMKMGYIFYGFLIGYSGGFIVLMPIFNIPVYPIGNLGICLYTWILAYAILKHQVMDIRIIIQRTALYSFWALIVSIVYVMLVFLFHIFSANAPSDFLSDSVRSILSFSEEFKITPYFYSLSFTSLFSIILGTFVLFKNPSTSANRLWFLATIACSIWSFFFMIMTQTNDLNWARISVAIVHIAASWLVTLVVHFCYSITKTVNMKKKEVLISLYLVSVFFTIFAKSQQLWTVKPLMSFAYYISGGSFYHLFTIQILFTFIWSEIILLKSLKQANRDSRDKIIWISIAFAAGYPGGFMSILPVYGFHIEPFMMHFVWLYAVIITYAILKHQLMDIHIFIKKAAIFSLFTVFLSILSLAFVLITHSIIAESKSPFNSFVANFIGILFIAVMFKPLEIFFQKRLEKKFFKGTVSEIVDKNEKLAVELERRERLKSVGILAAGMAHEIKNPLTVINTFVEHLPKKIDDLEFRKKFIETLRHETQRMKSIVEDLLLFSKPKEPFKENFRASEMLNDIMLLLHDNCVKQGIKVHSNYSKQDMIYADKGQIRQAFLNILMNAIDAMKESGGELFISTSGQEKDIVVIVRDNGKGISQDKLPHIFDPFYTSKEQGTGLGLSITYSMLEKNDAKISVTSQECEGTIFKIIFIKRD